ncbi:hypothetical protein JI750_16520 [Flavobacterium sp. GN10]|uniref:Phage shock protein A (PspA) family protein n=1 Tax=Flavobacterium tagetis TaxID=2801336 RepID=A0ABS1KJV6_9FLAO|nr:hypothetical protein [Flavobacterium tagetis]MBL0738501.1 hypothetical protein [Flavobacterium tagetis]
MEIYLIGIIITISGLYFKTYIQEKAKIDALKSENKKLIEQAEKIKSKYSKELEELKKEHQLEISKRRYKYESKRDQYVSFFQFLDQFTKDNTTKSQEKMTLIVNNFMTEFLNAQDHEGQMKAITTMSNEMQKLTFEASKDLIRIKQETNTIRLIASEKVIQKLDMLNLAFDKTIADSNKTLNDLPLLIMNDDKHSINENQRQLEESGKTVKKYNDELIALMREELDEI